VTLVFDGAAEPRMPGAVHIGGVDATPALAAGATVVFGD
jgi:PTS system glucitol/sorbitol-specific IIA component